MKLFPLLAVMATGCAFNLIFAPWQAVAMALMTVLVLTVLIDWVVCSEKELCWACRLAKWRENRLPKARVLK